MLVYATFSVYAFGRAEATYIRTYVCSMIFTMWEEANMFICCSTLRKLIFDISGNGLPKWKLTNNATVCLDLVTLTREDDRIPKVSE